MEKNKKNAETIIDFCGKYQRKNAAVTGILLEEDINIPCPVTTDSAEAEIIRMVVSKPEQALKRWQRLVLSVSLVMRSWKSR